MSALFYLLCREEWWRETHRSEPHSHFMSPSFDFYTAEITHQSGTPGHCKGLLERRSDKWKAFIAFHSHSRCETHGTQQLLCFWNVVGCLYFTNCFTIEFSHSWCAAQTGSKRLKKSLLPLKFTLVGFSLTRWSSDVVSIFHNISEYSSSPWHGPLVLIMDNVPAYTPEYKSDKSGNRQPGKSWIKPCYFICLFAE